MMAVKALLVLGMHRSGTSALTRVLNLCGLPLGSDFVPASADNPRGFWEHREVVAIHEQLLSALDHRWASVAPMPAGWRHHPAAAKARERLHALIDKEFSGLPVWGVKDPRLCRLVPMWIDLLAERDVEPRFLFVVRDPREVVESMWVRDRRMPPIGELLWAQHVLEPERATREHKRAMVAYGELFDDWRSVVARVEAQLDIGLSTSPGIEEEVRGFLDSGLRHHRFNALEAPSENVSSTIYAACLDARDDSRAWARIAHIGAVYEQGLSMFGRCLDDLSRVFEFSEDAAKAAGVTARGADAAAFIRDLQAAMVSRQGEAEGLWREKEWFREQTDALRQKVDALEKQLVAKQAEAEFVWREKEWFREQTDALRQKVDALERHLAAKQAEAEFVWHEKERFREQAEATAQRASDLEKSLAIEQAGRATLRDEHQHLKRELNDLRERFGALRQCHEAAQHRRLSLRERLTGRPARVQDIWKTEGD
uniref:Sulfotransferase family protein n=1 Tax=Mizugakiibacter sediminis TaxID=1475481 RepID=A0A0U1PBJ5_9GAMM